MLRTVNSEQVTAVRDMLLTTFSGPGHQIHWRRITSPSGVINARLHWLPAFNLWGHFSNEPHGENSRWICSYGTSIGSPSQTLLASIEINLAVDPSNRTAAGRALTDGSGGFYLGHKGILGGGRGGQMSMTEFRERIKGFVTEPIQLGNKAEEHIFIIAKLGAPNFLPRLRAYVAECERLRAFARQRSVEGFKGTTDFADDGAAGTFTPEPDMNGTGSGRPGDPYTIKRLHGRVVNALYEALGRKAVNNTQFDMRPDLYIAKPDGRMETLFEVKASSDTQSWFTALGQLVVYGAGQTPPPRRVLVCPAMRQDPTFQNALAQLAVTVITFEEAANGDIHFNGLGDLLAPKAAE